MTRKTLNIAIAAALFGSLALVGFAGYLVASIIA